MDAFESVFLQFVDQSLKQWGANVAAVESKGGQRVTGVPSQTFTQPFQHFFSNITIAHIQHIHTKNNKR